MRQSIIDKIAKAIIREHEEPERSIMMQLLITYRMTKDEKGLKTMAARYNVL